MAKGKGAPKFSLQNLIEKETKANPLPVFSSTGLLLTPLQTAELFVGPMELSLFPKKLKFKDPTIAIPFASVNQSARDQDKNTRGVDRPEIALAKLTCLCLKTGGLPKKVGAMFASLQGNPG